MTHTSSKNMKFDERNEIDEKEEDENLWLEILSQVQESSSNKLPSHKTLLVLGDNESGKTSLIAKLQGNEDPKKGSGLEYHYIYVRDDYRDDHTRLGVCVLDGDPWHRNLLKFVLNEDTFQDVTILLTAAMTQPWDLLDSLQNWVQILEEHIQRLKIPKDVLEEHKNRVMKRIHDYVEPGSLSSEIDSVTSPVVNNKPFEVASDTAPEKPHSLGLEIIVIITKTDYMSTLQKDFDFKEEHFDFIQLNVRNFCLKYGASLFYLSVKEDKNCSLLSKYLLHRIYSLPFGTAALVVDKDAVFVPAGWDNHKKINILAENLTSVKADDSYHEVIAKPANTHTHRKPLQREAEVVAEDDQAFVTKLQNMLNQQVLTTGGRQINSQDTPIRAPLGVQKTADRRISGPPGVQASPKKIEGKASAVGGEGVLQNFFNSLLNRRTGPPIGGPLASMTSEKPSARHSPASELDRVAARSKKPSFGQSPEPPYSEDGDADSSSEQS